MSYQLFKTSLANFNSNTGRFRRLGRCFIDWATAVVGEGDTCQLSVSFNYHSSGPIYETLAQSTEFHGTYKGSEKLCCPIIQTSGLVITVTIFQTLR